MSPVNVYEPRPTLAHVPALQLQLKDFLGRFNFRVGWKEPALLQPHTLRAVRDLWLSCHAITSVSDRAANAICTLRQPTIPSNP